MGVSVRVRDRIGRKRITGNRLYVAVEGEIKLQGRR